MGLLQRATERVRRAVNRVARGVATLHREAQYPGEAPDHVRAKMPIYIRPNDGEPGQDGGDAA